MGRGMTLANCINFGGIFVFQALTGMIAGQFAAPGEPPPVQAYQWIFGFLTAAVVLSLLAYCRSEDVKPH